MIRSYLFYEEVKALLVKVNATKLLVPLALEFRDYFLEGRKILIFVGLQDSIS